MNNSTFETVNQEAVRGGYAMRKMSLRSTRATHAMDNGRGQMYLCQCAKPIRGVEGYCKFNIGRSKDSRFGDRFRYGWTRRPA